MIKILKQITHTIHKPKFHEIKLDKFKMNKISINFITPISPQTASLNAALSLILKQQCQAFPSPAIMGKKLKNLYGAELDSDCLKIGDLQLITFSISVLKDNFALNNEPLLKEAFNLLLNVVFKPKLNEQLQFTEQDVQIQKKNLIEIIQNKLSDKLKFAVLKAEKLLFAKQACATFSCGSIKSASKITAADLTQAYFNLLKTSQIHIITCGANNLNQIKAQFEKFSNITVTNSNEPSLANTPFITSTNFQLKRGFITDKIYQSKLIMCFAANKPITKQQLPAVKLMTLIFGGTPTSKLFTIVREQLNYCYFCSAKFNPSKNLIWVVSGVNKKNLKLTEKAINEQLTQLKNECFSAQELTQAKLAFKTSLQNINDNLNSLESLCLTQIIHNNYDSIPKLLEQINSVQRSHIVEAAKFFKHVLTFTLEENDSLN